MANSFGTDILIQARLVAEGCVVVKDEPEVPRTYVRDPYGLINNLTV